MTADASPSDAARQKAAFAIVSEIALRDSVDEHALRRIGLLGDAAIPALRDALGFRERVVRRFAIQALAALGSRRAIAPLLNAVADLHGPDPDLAAIALRGVVPVLEATDAERVAPFLDELAGHPDRFLRAAVADGFGQLGAPVASETLERLARDPDPFVAERAVIARSGVEIPLLAEDGDSLFARLADHDGATRLAAVDELATHHDRAPLIAAQLRTPHPRLRRGVLEAAARASDADLAGPLLELIEAPGTRDHDKALALQGLAWSADLDLMALGRSLDRHSQCGDVFVRAEAFAAGIRIGVPHADELLDRGVRDPSEHVRERVLKAWNTASPDRSGPATPAAVDRVSAMVSALEAGHVDVDDDVHRGLWRGLAHRAASGGYVEPAVDTIARRALVAAAATGRDAARSFLEARGVGVPLTTASPDTLAAWLASGDDSLRAQALDALEASTRLVHDQLEALLRALYVAPAPQMARIAELLAHSADERALAARASLRGHADASVRQAAGAAGTSAHDASRAERAARTLDALEDTVRAAPTSGSTDPTTTEDSADDSGEGA